MTGPHSRKRLRAHAEGAARTAMGTSLSISSGNEPDLEWFLSAGLIRNEKRPLREKVPLTKSGDES